MNRTDHTTEYEELMAYLDGELSPQGASRVERHLASCEACRSMAVELREGTARLAVWEPGSAPPMQPPARLRNRRIWGVPVWVPPVSPPAALATAAGVCVAILVGLAMLQGPNPARPAAEYTTASRSRPAVRSEPSRLVAPEAAQAPAESAMPIRMGGAEQGEVSQGPLLVRTARVSLIPRDFDAARADLDRIVTASGGFIGRIVVSGARQSGRSLSATVRVPAASLEEALAALKRLGTVTDERQDAEAVTQQSVDLDARLSNGRASERRLKDILDRRTGELSDVLAVEREIARVREEIERMEAERKSLDGRIAFASVSVEMSEERKAAVDLGQRPLGTRFRNAFVDGCAAVFSGLVAIGLVLTSVLPTLLVASIVAAPLLIVHRRRRARQIPHTSSR